MILMTYVIYRDKKSLNTEYVKTFEVELKVCKNKKNKLKKKFKTKLLVTTYWDTKHYLYKQFFFFENIGLDIKYIT